MREGQLEGESEGWKVVALPHSGILGTRRFWEGKRYFSPEVPVSLLSIHVKKNRSATIGH